MYKSLILYLLFHIFQNLIHTCPISSANRHELLMATILDNTTLDMGSYCFCLVVVRGWSQTILRSKWKLRTIFPFFPQKNAHICTQNLINKSHSGLWSQFITYTHIWYICTCTYIICLLYIVHIYNIMFLINPIQYL